MKKFNCYVENAETGFVKDGGVIEAENISDAEVRFYEENPDCGFEGDTFVAEEVDA